MYRLDSRQPRLGQVGFRGSSEQAPGWGATAILTVPSCPGVGVFQSSERACLFPVAQTPRENPVPLPGPQTPLCCYIPPSPDPDRWSCCPQACPPL